VSGQLSSELLKLRTTRMAGLLLLAAAGLTLLGVFVEGASASAAELAATTSSGRSSAPAAAPCSSRPSLAYSP
jgi:hypothetical protein